MSPSEEDGNSDIELNNIHIYAHPSVEGYEPIDVGVTAERDGSEVYDENHTISDPSTMEGFEISEQWMESRAEYSVTVTTSIHDEPEVFTSKEYEDRVSNGSQEEQHCIDLKFRITPSTIRAAPISGFCSTDS
ncbi:uncharacterized protein Nmag_3654 (plasmid) [Natrialba magadii ATCC 43099]|uniref:Uncharacterized protein n=1 Tax=Natrialba magadii (strain ATCC 43099 / DSM 3394 / CCM 3739 / CIP 104546 / IAM 13178 / JCM 8861 / NBRC 102185 / NCIMB 2190 / MS3) TaxID=547559 RepID=D3T0U3_NATMM|nr:hypothetical protein [Natrialba magadii]ADD07202.1 uncharacterized protein Nmag_3654 [Natrialba magadii ATCC 43099]ELY34316.1 hypothetical protein C500_00227 [Natrialba magadii ATCC 43099]